MANKKGFFISSETPAWVDKESLLKFKNEDFRRIVDFFVFLNPCKSICKRADFSAFYNWKSPWRKPYKLNEQLKKASSNPKLLFSAENYEAVESALEKSRLKDNFPDDISNERVCFHNGQSSQFMSLFYHLRNSFAHSRFAIKDNDNDWIFIFEDVTGIGENTRVSARMILKKSTLLKWIEIIEGGEKK